MRTTLTIDDDVLAAAKERARLTGRSAGEVLSELVRIALTGVVVAEESVHGWEAFPRRGGVVTNELIDALRAGRRRMIAVMR